MTTTRDPAALEARRAELRKIHLKAADQRPASTARGLHHTALISSDVERTIRGRLTSSSTSGTAT